MTSLLTRLRQSSFAECQEAADEIDRLQQVLSAATRTTAAFRSLGIAPSIIEQLSARLECQSAVTDLDAAIRAALTGSEQ